MTTPEPTPDHVPVYCSAHETYHGSLTHCDSCGRYQAHFPLEVCQTPHFHQPIHDAADAENKRLRAENARLRPEHVSMEYLIGRIAKSANPPQDRMLLAHIDFMAAVVEAARHLRSIVGAANKHGASCDNSPCDVCEDFGEMEDDAGNELDMQLARLDAAPGSPGQPAESSQQL